MSEEQASGEGRPWQSRDYPPCCVDAKGWIEWGLATPHIGPEVTGWVIYVGGSSFINVRFCPFCGTLLPLTNVSPAGEK